MVLTAQERRLLVDIAKEHNLFLISDEVYRELVYGGQTPSSMLEYQDAAEHVAIVDSVSKRFSATGSRVGGDRLSESGADGARYENCPGTPLCRHTGSGGCRSSIPLYDTGYYAGLRAEYQHRRDAVVE